MFGTIGAVAVSAIPEANAMMTPNQAILPSVLPTAGSIITLQVNPDAGATSPHVGGKIRVYGPGSMPGGPALNMNNVGATNCAFPAIGGAGPVWELQSGAAAVQYTIDEAGGMADSLSVTFGGGAFAMAPVVTLLNPTGTALVTAGPYTWFDVNGAVLDNTSIVGAYQFVTCGFDGGGVFPPYAPTTILQYTSSLPFLPQPPVGGEIIPINTVSLFAAGIQSNAVGILTALVAIGGSGLGLLYFQVRRK